MKTKVKNLTETRRLAIKLANELKAGDVVLLNGDLGAGKTTFVRYVLRHLKVKAVINSPTFAILKTYYGKFVFHHFDFYRINTDEAIEAGFDEVLSNPTAIKFVEWGQNVQPLLPENAIKINIKFIAEKIREVEITNIKLKG